MGIYVHQPLLRWTLIKLHCHMFFNLSRPPLNAPSQVAGGNGKRTYGDKYPEDVIALRRLGRRDREAWYLFSKSGESNGYGSKLKS